MNFSQAFCGTGGTGSLDESSRPDHRSMSRARTNCMRMQVSGLSQTNPDRRVKTNLGALEDLPQDDGNDENRDADVGRDLKTGTSAGSQAPRTEESRRTKS